MHKYFNLTKHLANVDAEQWETTFVELENILGFSLPESARRHRAWWANQGHAQSAAWLSACYKTADVDLANERVKFVYYGDGIERGDLAPAKLTIAEAKAGLAANFGVSVEAVEITIRG